MTAPIERCPERIARMPGTGSVRETGAPRARRGSVFLVFAVALSFLAPAISRAADRYVSPSGADTGDCSSIGAPCATPTYCYMQMGPGDNCNLRAGTYTAPSGGFVFQAFRGCTAAAPCTIRGYQSEVAVIHPVDMNSMAGGTAISVRGGTGTTSANWSGGAHYIRFAYLTIYGKTELCGLSDCSGGGFNVPQGFTMDHNVIKCLTPGSTLGNGACDNTAHLYTQKGDVYGDTYARSTLNDGHIYENLFIEDDAQCNNYPWHSSTCTIESEHNDTLLLYGTKSWVIENNDFIYNFSTSNLAMARPIWFKNSNGQNTIRYNYIEDNSHSLTTFCPGYTQHLGTLEGSTGFGARASGGSNRWYQNISNGTSSNIFFWQNDVYGEKVYNNTFYSDSTNPRPNQVVNYGDKSYPSISDTADLELFNNIFVGNYQKYIDLSYGSSTFPVYDASNPTGNMFIYLNNNLYYDPAGTTLGQWDESGTSFNSLSTWTNYLTNTKHYPSAVTDGASKWSNPLFVSPSTKDFHLQAGSTARTGGRGAAVDAKGGSTGSYATIMGAYITGSETIGCTFDPLCHAYGGSPPPTNPAAVTGVTRADKQ